MLLAQEELTYMQMKQRNLAVSDPEREEEDQENTHVPWAQEKNTSNSFNVKTPQLNRLGWGEKNSRQKTLS